MFQHFMNIFYSILAITSLGITRLIFVNKHLIGQHDHTTSVVMDTKHCLQKRVCKFGYGCQGLAMDGNHLGRSRGGSSKQIRMALECK